MKRIIFIIISTLIAPSIFGSIFESIDSLHRFLDTNDDSIINYISKSMNNHSFCIASPIYIDTTYYAVEIQYSKEKIIGFQTIYAKKNKKRSFFRCGYDNSGNKKYIKGNVDTMQFDIIESWIKKLNIDSLINNDCVMFISKTNLYSFSFIYFTIPLTTDTINKTMGYIDIHRSDSIEFCYFERDYLGSIRAVTDADGRLLQSVDYHVSGNPVVNVVSDRQATNRLHTGKEFLPFQGVALYDNQARYYDPIGSKFLTMDPLCEKYPSLSPYSHCANNPLSIIDPTGMEIWVNDIEYSIGMNYNGSNDFEKNTISALNTINNNGGDELIKGLVASDNKYNYISTDAKRSRTLKIDEDNYKIKISSNLNGKHDEFFSAVAHESMHGIQYENGQGGNYIYNEVEAYAFEYAISINSLCSENTIKYRSNSVSFNDNFNGRRFGKAMNYLIFNGYSEEVMQTAVANFKLGSGANNNGMYNSLNLYPDKLDSPRKSMLNLYLKIIK